MLLLHIIIPAYSSILREHEGFMVCDIAAGLFQRKLLPFSDIVFKYLEQPSYYSRKEGQSGERIAITGVWNCDALRLLHILRLFKDKGSAMAVWGVVRGDPASVHSCPLTPTLQLATKCQLGRTCHSV
ncbi:hypothetical protein J6590_040705 [Homalodisca vitripennis]|nr:hypothetical protein J6590_040705 [Homalodisca vitripennis]